MVANAAENWNVRQMGIGAPFVQSFEYQIQFIATTAVGPVVEIKNEVHIGQAVKKMRQHRWSQKYYRRPPDGGLHHPVHDLFPQARQIVAVGGGELGVGNHANDWKTWLTRRWWQVWIGRSAQANNKHQSKTKKRTPAPRGGDRCCPSYNSIVSEIKFTSHVLVSVSDWRVYP